MPLFFRDYYLDAVCIKGGWDVRYDDNDGYFVYHFRKIFFYQFWLMPQLTPYLGWLDAKKSTVTLPSMTMSNISGLPARDAAGNAYTYIIPATCGTSYDMVMASRKHRNYIRKMSTMYRVEEIGWNEFRQHLPKMFTERNRSNPFNMEVLERVEESLSKRSERVIFAAKDEDDSIKSTLYLVYDERTAYLLVSGQYSKNRSNYALIAHAINWALSRGLDFDFEGSMIPNVERFFKGFGGEKYHYTKTKQYRPQWMQPILERLIPGLR